MKCDFELILLQNYSSVMDRATATKGKRVNILKLTASGNLDAWQVLGIGLPPQARPAQYVQCADSFVYLYNSVVKEYISQNSFHSFKLSEHSSCSCHESIWRFCHSVAISCLCIKASRGMECQCFIAEWAPPVLGLKLGCMYMFIWFHMVQTPHKLCLIPYCA